MSKADDNSQWDGVIWEGVYSSFDETEAELDVHDGSVWVEKETDRILRDVETYKSGDPHKLLCKTMDHALPFIAAALNNIEERIKIIDFGGGLGSAFFSLKSLLPRGKILDYMVIENKEICARGETLLKDFEEITFLEDIPESMNVDIVCAENSFQYVDDWIGQLKKFSECSPQYIIFTGLTAANNKTFVTVQNYYGRKMPVRFWAIEEFIFKLNDLNYELILNSIYTNKDKYLSYMQKFDKQHRLSFYSQLVFRKCK